MRMIKMLVGALAFAPLMAFAQVSLTTTAFHIVAVKQADGSVTEEWQKPENIVPGDLVGYRIHYVNSGKETATDVVVNNPVPENTEYVVNSAAGMNSQITYSADQGKKFARAAELTVEENGAQRPAKASEITHIRWSINSVAAGSSGDVEFKVRVK